MLLDPVFNLGNAAAQPQLGASGLFGLPATLATSKRPAWPTQVGVTSGHLVVKHVEQTPQVGRGDGSAAGDLSAPVAMGWLIRVVGNSDVGMLG